MLRPPLSGRSLLTAALPSVPGGLMAPRLCRMSAFGGKADIMSRCLLLTQSGHSLDSSLTTPPVCRFDPLPCLVPSLG
jgi:hypothetical protein